ncbi:hypothetical protein NA57DRAFT_80217 [Rhizodiscina lignyota]|uniref:Uncharacterized protein n=1 Tax=Rhizodiscina lignyota TaxID=1504668 RepID=A0A9P4M291_9PEZI|nr:hypothetical protein NA57DRAFT_80217 [Rhizodiscina lignyota]
MASKPDSHCEVVELLLFEESNDGFAVVIGDALTYKELLESGYEIYAKDANTYDLWIYTHQWSYGSRISAPKWDKGDYFKLAKNNALKVYARFISRQSQVAKRNSASNRHVAKRQVQLLLESSPSDYDIGESTPTPPQKRAKLVSPAPTGATPSSSADITPSPKSLSPAFGAVGGDNRPISAQTSGCCHRAPPMPQSILELKLPFVARTLGMFDRWVDFKFSVLEKPEADTDMTYHDVRSAIASSINRRIPRGRVQNLTQFKRQIHFEVFLGPPENVQRMHPALRVMDYLPPGATASSLAEQLFGHIEVWLEHDGVFFGDIDAAFTDAQIASGIVVDFSSAPMTAKAITLPAYTTLPKLEPDLHNLVPYCLDQITIHVHVKDKFVQNKIISGDIDGHFSGASNLTEVQEALFEKMLKWLESRPALRGQSKPDMARVMKLKLSFYHQEDRDKKF